MKLFAGIAFACTLALSGTDAAPVAPFRKAGNSVVYEFADHRSSDVNRYDHTLLIRKVSQSGNVFVVSSVLGFANTGEFEPMWYMKFGYSDSCFYAWTYNRMYPSISDGAEDELILKSDSLTYPFSMQAGDSLPGGSSTQSYDDQKKRVTLRVYGRFVKQLDTLELNCGTIPAYRIESAEEWGSPGTKKEIRHRTEWFSPKYGLVKWQSNLGSGNGYTVTTLYRLPE